MMVDEANLRNKIQPAYTILELLKEHKPVSDHFVDLALKNLKEIFNDKTYRI